MFSNPGERYTNSALRPMMKNPGVIIRNESSSLTSQVNPCLDYFLSSYRWAHWWKSLVYLGLQSHVSSASHKSTESLLMGYFAVAHEDPKLLAKSRNLYGEGLQLVSSALTFQTTECFAELTLPIMILSMHPVRFLNSKSILIAVADYVFTIIVCYGQVVRSGASHWTRGCFDALRPWQLPGPGDGQLIQILQIYAGMSS
jgi:hypothetical protein